MNTNILRRLLLLCTVLLLTPQAWGDPVVIGMVVWQPSPDLPRFIIPTRIHESPPSAVRHYLRGLARKKDPESARILAALRPYDLGTQSGPLNFSLGQPPVLLVAQSVGDHYPDSELLEVVRHLRKKGFPVYVLPLMADERLSPPEREAFQELLDSAFPSPREWVLGACEELLQDD